MVQTTKEINSMSKGKSSLVMTGIVSFLITILFILVTSQYLPTHYFTFLAGLVTGLAIFNFFRLYTNFKAAKNTSSADSARSLRNHQRLIDAVEKIEDGFIIYNKDNKIVYANKKMHSLYDGIGIEFKPGIDRKDITRAAYAWFDDGPQKENIKKLLDINSRLYFEEKKNVPWDLPNGNSIVINEKLIHDDGMVAVVHDVTEQVKNRKELDSQSSLLNNIFESLPIGITVYDRDHRIINWNERCR